MRSQLLIGVALVGLSGCDFAPEMKLEDFFTNAALKEDAPVAKPEAALDGPTISTEELGAWKRVDEKAKIEETAWWRMFKMPEMDALVEQAMQQNPTLEVAAQRLAAARGQADVAGAALFPSVEVGAGPQRQKSAAANINANMPPGTTVTTKPFTTYTAQGAISYTLDLFGKTRNTVKAAALSVDAEANNYRAARLLLQAEIARTYIARTALLTEKNLLARVLRGREDTREHIRKKLKVGSVDALAIANADYQVSIAQADISAVQQQLTSTEHALATLVGVTPAQLALKENATLEKVPPTIPSGLKAQLLERRPDVQSAAAQIAVANARIGAARAAYLPDISLSAVGGFTSAQLSDLFKKPSQFWSLGPMMGAQVITQPLFEGGAIEGTMAARKAEYAGASANYKESVLQAFREVEDSLSGLRNLRDQAQANAAALDAAKRAYVVADNRYKVGYSSQIEFLEAERNRLMAERAAVQVLGQRYVTTIQLVKALGGSW